MLSCAQATIERDTTMKHSSSKDATQTAAEAFASAVQIEGENGRLYRKVRELAGKKCKELSWETRADIYARLRSGGFICQSPEDVYVYIERVADKHRDKFKAVYDRLITAEYIGITRRVDLVVWGCGCGLDIAALCDALRSDTNAGRWLEIRSVLLLDISETALTFAKALTRKLLPVTRVRSIHFDITRLDEDECKKRLSCEMRKDRFRATPRVHLFSNILDLLKPKEVRHFGNTLTDLMVGWNSAAIRETVVAYSPTYKKYNSTSEDKMSAFREGLSQGKVEVASFGDNLTIDRAACALFHVYTNRKRYDLWHNKLNKDTEGHSLGVDLLRIADHRPDLRWEKLWDALCDAHCGRNAEGKLRPLSSRYCAARLDGRVLCLIPKLGVLQRKLVLALLPPIPNSSRVTKDDKEEKETLYATRKRLAQRLAQNEDSKTDYYFHLEIVRDTENPYTLETVANPGSGHGNIDFMKAFLLQWNSSMAQEGTPTSQQQKLIDDRHQLRKVRGGPGTGKTYALIWHIVRLYLRTQQPILVVIKTHSLLGVLEQKFMATLEKISTPEVIAKAREGDVRFRTLESLVSQDKDTGKYEAYREAIGANAAIMVDELQVLDPEAVKLLYNTSGEMAPSRQFYLFCDEEQTLHNRENVLELASEESNCAGTFRVVRAPDKGFGRFITLKENQRAVSQELAKKLSQIQYALLSDKYDMNALQMMPTQSIEPEYLLEELTPIRFIESSPLQEPLPLSSNIKEQFEKIPYPASNKDASYLEVPGVTDCHRIGVERATEVAKVLAPIIQTAYGNLNSERDELLIVCSSMTMAQYLPDELEKEPSLHKWKGRFSRTHRWNEEFGKLRWAQKQKSRQQFRKGPGHLYITTVDCAMGHTFPHVIFLFTRNANEEDFDRELFLTGISRASQSVCVVDASQGHQVAAFLRKQGVQELRIAP